MSKRRLSVAAHELVNTEFYDTYGRAAGDLIIAETAKRIDSALPHNMLMFRTGGDEFAIVTGYSSILNGSPVIYDGKEIPLCVRIYISKLPSDEQKYKETFSKIHDSIVKVRKENVFIGLLDE